MVFVDDVASLALLKLELGLLDQLQILVRGLVEHAALEGLLQDLLVPVPGCHQLVLVDEVVLVLALAKSHLGVSLAKTKGPDRLLLDGPEMASVGNWINDVLYHSLTCEGLRGLLWNCAIEA